MFVFCLLAISSALRTSDANPKTLGMSAQLFVVNLNSRTSEVSVGSRTRSGVSAGLDNMSAGGVFFHPQVRFWRGQLLTQQSACSRRERRERRESAAVTVCAVSLAF